MLPKSYKINLVKQSEVQDVANNLWRMHEQDFGFDTETYGTGFDDRMFSLAISTETEGWYFNMYQGADHLGGMSDHTISYASLKLLEPVFSQGAWYAHNAKFDLGKLKKEDIVHNGKVRCTQATERLIRNDRIYYSLKEVAKNYGYEKDMTIDEYIKDNKLYESRFFSGKNLEKVPMFYKVPYFMLSKYALNDAYLHLMVGRLQRERLFQVV